MPNVDGENQHESKVATLFLLATAVYLAMMIFGAINFHACPDTRLAIYMVVQGVIASLNAGSAALVIICNCYTRIFHKTFMTIYVFNLVWSGIGGWWMVVCCPGTFLVNIAVGFTVPIWTPLAIFCCCCCCLICGSCSDD